LKEDVTVTMAALCLASYGSFDDYKQIAADHHYEIIKASANPYVGWKLLESQDNYVFVYPGTNDWTDLIVDVMARISADQIRKSAPWSQYPVGNDTARDSKFRQAGLVGRPQPWRGTSKTSCDGQISAAGVHIQCATNL